MQIVHICGDGSVRWNQEIVDGLERRVKSPAID